MENNKHPIPEEFEKIIKEFTISLLEVYPEYKNDLQSDLETIINGTQTIDNIEVLFQFCNSVYPINIFPIMGKSDDIFSDVDANTEFLPGIEFKNIWKDTSISTNTKETIWKYLQLILFTVVGNVPNMESFGDTAKIFESLDESELKNKMQETFKNMEQMFSNANQSADQSADQSNDQSNPQFTMPDMNNIHDHLKGLISGKLGMLATEIAEETVQEFKLDDPNNSSIKDVFTSMMKNPTKLMGIANKIGDKLETKMKSGELDEKELMKEAADMFAKLKNTPGMGDIEKMMKSMGGLGGKGKIDMNAMQKFMDRNINMSKMKERFNKKSELKRDQLIKEQEHKVWADSQPDYIHPDFLEEGEKFISGDKPNRTPRNASAPENNNNKKKKGKK